jgi:hypothetical protein
MPRSSGEPLGCDNVRGHVEGTASERRRERPVTTARRRGRNETAQNLTRE